MPKNWRAGRPRKQQVRIRKSRYVSLKPVREEYWLISCSECGRLFTSRSSIAQTDTATCRKRRQRRMQRERLAAAMWASEHMPQSACYRDGVAGK